MMTLTPYPSGGQQKVQFSISSCSSIPVGIFTTHQVLFGSCLLSLLKSARATTFSIYNISCGSKICCTLHQYVDQDQFLHIPALLKTITLLVALGKRSRANSTLCQPPDELSFRAHRLIGNFMSELTRGASWP